MTPRERLVQAENLALRLALDGYSPRQIAERTGLRDGQVRTVLEAFTRRRPPMKAACPESLCGLPRDTPGRPRVGWLQIKSAASKSGTWFCSWPCLLGYALRHTTALPPAQEQP